MADKDINVIIKQKTDTQVNWELNNPVLQSGEIGIDTTNKLFKIGDGITPWSLIENYYISDLNNLTDADDVMFSDGDSLQDKFDDGELGGSGSGSGAIVEEFNLPPQNWISSMEYDNFLYQADVAINGLTENDVAQVMLNTDSVYIANKAFVMTGADIVGSSIRLYSRKLIDSPLVGLCLIIKGVG